MAAFEKARSFLNGSAEVHIDGVVYLIDKQGRFVWGPEHDIPIELIEKLLNE